MERFYILALAVLLVISCSLTENGATMSAAVAKTPPGRPLQADSLKPTQTPTTSPLRCTVTAGYLNFRACGATSCDVIEVLEEGEMLAVIDAGSWYHVQTEAGAAGWINSKFCKLEK